MAGYTVSIERETLENEAFRTVLYTAPNLQLAVMTLRPGEDVGMELHDESDQFIRVEDGDGEAILNAERHLLGDGTSIVIPAGVEHNIVNTSTAHPHPLRLSTMYAPPEHLDATIHRTRAEADAAEKAHRHQVDRSSATRELPRLARSRPGPTCPNIVISTKACISTPRGEIAWWRVLCRLP